MDEEDRAIADRRSLSEQGGWLPYGKPSVRSLKDLSTPLVHEAGE